MSLPDALRGPWVAVLTGPDDFTRDSPDDVANGDFVDISVVRRGGIPVDGRIPYAVNWDTDVLYATDWFSADPTEQDGGLRTRWTQAQAVAHAMNALADPDNAARLELRLRPPAPPGPADADSVWVGEPIAGAVMHRPVDSGRRTGCDHRAFGGRTTTAANARQRWGSQPCSGCWPVTS